MEVETVRTHLQNGRSTTGEDSDVGNGGRRSALWKTAKKMVWRHHGLVRTCMFAAVGYTTGERQTTVEANHWPQWTTWVLSSKEEKEEATASTWGAIRTTNWHDALWSSWAHRCCPLWYSHFEAQFKRLLNYWRLTSSSQNITGGVVRWRTWLLWSAKHWSMKTDVINQLYAELRNASVSPAIQNQLHEFTSSSIHWSLRTLVVFWNTAGPYFVTVHTPQPLGITVLMQ